MANKRDFERIYVGRWVPRNPKAITALMIVVAVINSATLGYDASMMNGLNILPQYVQYFNLDTATTGLNNAATWIGGMLACFVLQPICDLKGRKVGIFIAACICLIGTIIQSAAHNIATFVIGRMFIGFGSNLASGAAPTLISEILPPTSRGSVLGFFFSCFYVGSLLSAGINYRVVEIDTTWAWRIPSIIQSLPSLLALCCLPFVPESPRWLLSRGRREEAAEVLAVMNGTSPDDGETITAVSTIESVLRKEEALHPRNPWRELVATKANRRRLFIVATFGVMIEMFGNFVISRVQALTCITGMIVMLYIFGGLAKVYGTGSENKSGIYGTIAALFLFQGFYAFSITPLTCLYPPEVMSFKIRNCGRAVFAFFDNGFGLLAAFTMSFAMADLGWKFYFINASWNIGFLAIVYFLWVETARVPLEEIALKFGDLHYEDIAVPSMSEMPVEDIAAEHPKKA
ncbi:hypothetical protein LTR67_007918 [Exophiala xenobiotica]